MLVSWSVMWIVGLICYSDCTCSHTSFYKSCWIRRYPGVDVDVEESQRRGAHILKTYHEDTASKCSRSCCTTHNFSCGLAVFHYNTTEDSVNCFHLNCSNPDICVLHHRRNVILYHVTKGVDPDLLVFGKHFTTNVRVLPHLSSSRLNLSEPLTSDKRHFNHPPVRSISPTSTSTTKPTTGALSTTHSIHNHLTRCATRPPSIILTALLPKTDSQPPATQPTNSTTVQLYTTVDFIHTTTTGSSSTTPSGILLTNDAQSSSTSGSLSTQQTHTRSDTVTKTTNSETTPYITELSTTNRQESSQTTSPRAEMTRAPSSSKSLTTLKSLTALQTNTPPHTTIQITTTFQTTSQSQETTTASSSTISTSTRRTDRNRTSDSTTSSRADSQPYPNDTKGYVSRNISVDDGGSLTSVWRLAANTVLVVLGTCASVTLGCCCSVYAALSWRGRWRRKGRYRTNLRGKRGSMKLIKYVIVRESS
ncbi:MANSC domain-containing protein 4-like [Triplophysa dalaica]|uniref:MANSC domain-containing protein 4-like n=1 Tax=Triplophysa dalaica TaxID=1582913 RepID=UPI0024DF880E|nr:MANSC domain-containing protein 4-like [Triplophysa dalaica]